MAWMRMMGAQSVAYHRETIIERADDFPGAALEYYASRGETPLVWGGSGAPSLGLTGAVGNASYDAIYGPGGATDPSTGRRLVNAKRPGMELVIAAHKSVAELGVLGRAEDMHAIMDAERDATLTYLDELTRSRGGRRGVAGVATATSGLLYAHARHATTRAGDPGPHDHVLLANVVEMHDDKGGTKAPDTTLWREHLHAATMVGRLASARVAVTLGYGIEADAGPTGKLGHWKIAGIPEAVTALHATRSAEIDAELARRGFSSYQARQVAARETRAHKRHDPVEALVPRWQAELSAAGYPPPALLDAVESAGRDYRRDHGGERPLSKQERSRLAVALLSSEGALSAKKVFSRRDVIVAITPALYGRDPAELAPVADRVLRDPEAIALLGVPRASEPAYATATVLGTERAIADAVARGVASTDAATVPWEVLAAALEHTSQALGAPLTAGQMAAVTSIATSGRQVELVQGVAGSGKTTVMAVLRQGFEASGCTVVGTSTSGQAARTLGRAAAMAESRTLASLRWRLEHDRLRLTARHVLVLDEAGMATDRDVAFLLDQARLAGAKVVMVGDDRQLGAVGLGGALGALVERHGGVLHVLPDNLRTRDEAERQALLELRAGDLSQAVAFYVCADRVVLAPGRDEALCEMAGRWAHDIGAGREAAMFAWRRANVAELNRLGREIMAAEGRLSGPELLAPGGAAYAAGDRIVTLAPGADGKAVTSERAVVRVVDLEHQCLTAQMEDGRIEHFATQEIGAARLAHGYATTVHRSQGSTCDTAHVYEDGGGRELAYVAMSRAREETHLYLAADDLEQATDDLLRNWATERRWRWAIDTGTPQIEQRDSAALRREALVAERAALKAAIPEDVTAALHQVRSRHDAARHELERLRADHGRTSEGELGRVAAQVLAARRERFQHERAAENTGLPRRIRRDARHGLERDVPRVRALEERLSGLFTAEEGRLTEALRRADEQMGVVSLKDTERSRWFAEHPEVPGRLAQIDTDAWRIGGEIDGARWAEDRDLSPAPGESELHEHSRSHDRHHDYDYGSDIEPPDYDFGL